tara:strand:+ start:4494 stop:4811 length:318 start_codon:yes stop_codon:yes gene_type:complete
MTEATKRPWSRDKYAYMTANNGENLYVAHGVTVPNGESHPRYAEALANEELILKAVNNHDALVAALEDAATWLHLASQNHGTSPLITKRHQDEAAKIEAVLDQVK